MAYRRSLSIRATLLARRFNPSFTYISHENDPSKQEEICPSGSNIESYLSQRRSFGSCVNISLWQNSGAFCRTGGLVGNGLSNNRSMSTSIGEADSFVNNDVTVITDAPVEAIATHAPAMSEVAIAAADSAFPVAALQYLIDRVHTFTGLNWWASIALTTLLIRSATVPFLLNQVKAATKLAEIRPKLEEIGEQMESAGMDSQAVAEGQKKMHQLLEQQGVTPFSPYKGFLISGPLYISLFFAIQNMVEKVPSFKDGGAFWFVDLTTPDPLYALPVMTALTFLATVEFNAQDGLMGNPMTDKMKTLSRGAAVLIVPCTVSFPKPQVKKALGIPDLPNPPPSASKSTNPPKTFRELLKRIAALTKDPYAASAPVEEPKSLGKKGPKSLSKKGPSVAALSRRVQLLEKQVKQKKRTKRPPDSERLS